MAPNRAYNILLGAILAHFEVFYYDITPWLEVD